MIIIGRPIIFLLRQIPLVLYVLWRGALMALALVGWVVGILVGTLIGGLASGFLRGYKG